MAVSQATQEIDVTQLSLDERSKYLRRLVVRTLQGGERGHVEGTARHHQQAQARAGCASHEGPASRPVPLVPTPACHI